MCCFSLEMQQFCNVDKFKESVDVAQLEYFRGNMKDYENQSNQPNKNQELQECIQLPSFLMTNWSWRSKTQIRSSKNAFDYFRFWTILMTTMVEERWASSFWVWQLPQQDFETPAMRDHHEPVRKVDFPCSYSNILKSAESRMLKTLQTCDKNEGRRREVKRADPSKLIRLQYGFACRFSQGWRGYPATCGPETPE